MENRTRPQVPFLGFRALFFLRERWLSSPLSNAAIPGHFLPRECPVMLRGSLVPFLPQEMTSLRCPWASVRLFGDVAPVDNNPLRCWWDTSSPLACPPPSLAPSTLAFSEGASNRVTPVFRRKSTFFKLAYRWPLGSRPCHSPSFPIHLASSYLFFKIKPRHRPPPGRLP